MKMKLNEEEANLWKQRYAAKPEYNSSKINDAFGIEYEAELEVNEKTGKMQLRESYSTGFDWFVALAVIFMFGGPLIYYTYLLITELAVHDTSNLVQRIVTIVILLVFGAVCFKLFVINYIKKLIAKHKQKLEDKANGIVTPKKKLTITQIIYKGTIWVFILELTLMVVLAIPEIFFKKVMVPHEYLPYVLLPGAALFALGILISLAIGLGMGTVLFIQMIIKLYKELKEEKEDRHE